MWLGRTSVLTANLVVSSLSTVAYLRRVFGITFGWADYVGALGIDHRFGWVEIGGLVSVALSIASHVIGTDWSIQRIPAPNNIPQLAPYAKGLITALDCDRRLLSGCWYGYHQSSLGASPAV